MRAICSTTFGKSLKLIFSIFSFVGSLSMRNILSLLLVFLFAFSSASASEEEFLPWKEVKIVCAENSETGKVVFDAQTDGNAYKFVSITTFGKQFKLDGPQLSKLKRFPLSSLSITHEAGYEQLGGHTVHFKMKYHRYQAPKVVEGRVVISVSKGKGLEIHGPETKEFSQKP